MAPVVLIFEMVGAEWSRTRREKNPGILFYPTGPRRGQSSEVLPRVPRTMNHNHPAPTAQGFDGVSLPHGVTPGLNWLSASFREGDFSGRIHSQRCRSQVIKEGYFQVSFIPLTVANFRVADDTPGTACYICASGALRRGGRLVATVSAALTLGASNACRVGDPVVSRLLWRMEGKGKAHSQETADYGPRSSSRTLEKMPRVSGPSEYNSGISERKLEVLAYIMAAQLSSNAETNALLAQGLQSFSSFNLLGVKQGLETLLAQFGRDGIFREYTKHDLSHVETLLQMLDWVVVPEAAKAMSPVDWMLAVLATYFHDAGLIVTRDEFANRSNTAFPDFKRQILASPQPSAYKERVEALDPEERERFLYQEFVRVHHAERIKHWVEGRSDQRLGVSHSAASGVSALLANLDENFKGDLAIVCESHHLDDLNDLDKYNPRRAYGSDPRETANLQFAAILLRTVDLLHVTKDRAPSLAFRLIAPSDPKSIEEWQKQMEVVAVRMAPPRDERGNVDRNATPDTIAVSATFRDPLGFFALTEYIHYAQTQLRQSNQWAEQAATREASQFHFPWRNIDSTQVKAKGFESRQFSFELDKPKILKLLTGHTLYNNSDVVIRELTQNSLDATRLQTTRSNEAGRIMISLDTATRMIIVEDNGTGMTQQIIEGHFLNVGNSLYNDDAFRKKNPQFSAISRFGIGILSIFMISDEVEVITKAAEEKEARNLSIRSLNGKYLIRILEPTDQGFPALLKEHGTRVQLRLRAGVPIPRIKEVAEFWILFPECEVTVSVDGEVPVRIGYSSPREALEKMLTKAGYGISSAEPDGYTPSYRVEQEKRDGLTMAYALRWQPLYKNWAFANPPGLSHVQPGQQPPIWTGVCIHGVRVQNSSPGFATPDPLAISNVTGPRSPATNVARSNLETSTQLDEMFTKVYSIYAGHISSEIKKMSSIKGWSISTAASEGRYLFSALQRPFPTEQCPTAEKLLNTQLRTVPCLTLDDGDSRRLISLSDLDTMGGFWTTEGGAYRSAEDLMRRIPTSISIAKLAAFIGTEDMAAQGSIVGGHSEKMVVRELVLGSFEVDRIDILRTKRQANLHWRRVGEVPLWLSLIPIDPQLNQRVHQLIQQFGQQGGIGAPRYRTLVLQNSEELEINGPDDEIGLQSSSRAYIFKGNSLHQLLKKSIDSLARGELGPEIYAFQLILANRLLSNNWRLQDAGILRNVEVERQVMSQQLAREISVTEEVRALVSNSLPSIFDPMRGERFQPISFVPGGVD